MFGSPTERDETTPRNEELNHVIARLKKEAKAAEGHIAICCF